MLVFTKCSFYCYIQDKKIPASIMYNDKPLPWVNAWLHLGNELDATELSKQFRSNMNSDTDNKRRKFIGKTHSLLQEFGFLDHNI